jgi:nucleotide-binding universal stress UspA family protein
MSTPSLSEGRAAASGTGPFATITCGVDGTRAAYEAARQAVLLARGGVRLRYLAVTWETGTLAPRMVTLARHRAEEALDRVRELAREAGVSAHCAIVDGPHAGEKLLEEAGEDDLLVVGASGRSHAGGLVLGHAASEVLRNARTSVLVTRAAPGVTFPASILVAVDDPALARAAADVADELARLHATTATMLAVEGRFHKAAAHAAAELGASLIVTAGEHAEKVAESARCSVLVLRPRS